MVSRDENIFCVWWKYFLCVMKIFFVCDENIFWCAMKIFFGVRWKYFLVCDENIFWCAMKIFFGVWWKYFLVCDENIFWCVIKIFFGVRWKYFLVWRPYFCLGGHFGSLGLRTPKIGLLGVFDPPPYPPPKNDLFWGSKKGQKWPFFIDFY
jgi:hypothetical protein